MRLVYLGTPEAAVPPLRALVEAGHDVALAVTQPDRKRGRGSALVASPVKTAATELGIPVAHAVDDVLAVGADLGVVVAFGKLIKPHVLDVLPMVNLHFSLLPRWRGAAPVERALLAGDAETGVCLMALDDGLDTGPVYAVERTLIGADEHVDELRDRLVAIGTRMLVEGLQHGLGEPRAQEGEATYAAKLDPGEHHLDWSQPALHCQRVVRLGRAWTMFRGKRLRVLRVAAGGSAASGDPGELHDLVVTCGDGHGLELVEVQPEGKGPQPAAAWRNGARPAPGELLG